VLNVVFTPGDTNVCGKTNLSVQLVVCRHHDDHGEQREQGLWNDVDVLGTDFMTSGLVAGDSWTNVNLVSAGAASGAESAVMRIVPAGHGTGLTNYSIAYSNGG